MRRWFALFALAAALVAATAVIAAADVPQMINYQGRLTDDAGEPINGTAAITFTICADSLGSACLWDETHPAVTVEDGLFNVILGSLIPIHYSVFDGEERWMGFLVDGEPVEPHRRLISMPYAHWAAVADTALVAMALVRDSRDDNQTDLAATVKELQEENLRLRERLERLEEAVSSLAE